MDIVEHSVFSGVGGDKAKATQKLNIRVTFSSIQKHNSKLLLT